MICIRERVEVVEGSYDNLTVVTEAFKGADNLVCWLSGILPGFSGGSERRSRKKRCRHESCFVHFGPDQSPCSNGHEHRSERALLDGN